MSVPSYYGYMGRRPSGFYYNLGPMPVRPDDEWRARKATEQHNIMMGRVSKSTPNTGNMRMPVKGNLDSVILVSPDGTPVVEENVPSMENSETNHVMANVNLVDDGFAEAGVDELITVRKEMMNGFGTNIKSLQNFSTTFNKLTKAIEDLAKTHEQLTIAYNNFDKHKSSSSYKTKQEKEKLENMEDSLDEALQLFDMGVKETYAKLATFPDPRRTTRRIKKRMENVEEQLKQSGYMEDIVSYFMDFGRLPADFVESNFPNAGNLIEKPIETPSLQIQRCPKDCEIDDVVQTDEGAKNKGSLDFFTEYHIEVEAGSLLGLTIQPIKSRFNYSHIVDEVKAGSPLAKVVDPQLILNKEVICINRKFVKNIDADEFVQLIRDICSVGGTVSLGIIHEPFANMEPIRVDVKEEPVQDKEDAVLQEQTETLPEYREIYFHSDESFTASEDSDSSSSDEEYSAIAARINASHSKDRKFPIKRSLSVGDLLAEWRNQEPVVEYHIAEEQNAFRNKAAPEVEKGEAMKAVEVENIDISIDKQLGTEDQNTLSTASESKYAERLLDDSSSEESDSDSDDTSSDDSDSDSDDTSSDDSDSTDGDSTAEDDISSLDTEESTTDDEMPGLEQMKETDGELRKMQHDLNERHRMMLSNIFKEYGLCKGVEPKMIPTTEPIVVQETEYLMPASQLITDSTETTRHPEVSQIVTEKTENRILEDDSSEESDSDSDDTSLDDSGLTDGDSTSEDDKSSLDTEESTTDDEMPGLEQMDETDSESRTMPSNSEEAARKLYLYNDREISSDISNNVQFMEEMLRQYKQIYADKMNKVEKPKLTPATEPIIVEGSVNCVTASQLITGSTETTGHPEVSQIVPEMKENLVAHETAVNVEESTVVVQEPVFTVVELLIILAVIVNIIVFLIL